MNIEEFKAEAIRQRNNNGFAGVRCSVQIGAGENEATTYLVMFSYDYTIHGCRADEDWPYSDRPCGPEESGCRKNTVGHLGIHTDPHEAIGQALGKLKSEGVREDIY